MRTTQKITIDKKKNFLKALNERSNDFILTTSLISFSSVVRDLKSEFNIAEFEDFKNPAVVAMFFKKVFRVAVEKASGLTSNERNKERYDFLNNNLINSDFSWNEDCYDYSMSRLVSFSKEMIAKSIAREQKIVLGFHEYDYSDESIAKKHLDLRVAKYMIFEEDADTFIEEAFKNSYKELMAKEIADVELEDDRIYAFRMKDNLDEMIDSGVLFDLITYKKDKRGMNINGERIEFMPEEGGWSFNGRVILGNDPNNFYCIADHNYTIFFSKEDAQKYKEEKIMKLKGLIKTAESVRF